MDEPRAIGRVAFTAHTDDGTVLQCVVHDVGGFGWRLTINGAEYAPTFPTVHATLKIFTERAALHGGVKFYADFEIDVSGADTPAGEAAAQAFVVGFLRCLGLRAMVDPAPRMLQ